MAFPTLLVAIVILFAGVVIAFCVWYFWEAIALRLGKTVEKTPHGWSSNLVMMYPDDSGNEYFKEAVVYGKHSVFLDKDWGNNKPTYYARPKFDYHLVKPKKRQQEGLNYFLSRLSKDRFPIIPQEWWDRKFKLKRGDYLSESWFIKQREDRVSTANILDNVSSKKLLQTEEMDLRDLTQLKIEETELRYLRRKEEDQKRAETQKPAS